MQITRQAIYYTPRRQRDGSSRGKPVDIVDQAIIDCARTDEHRFDGYRMITAIVRRKLGIAVNRKRVARVMREHGLAQPRRRSDRRKRPGVFRVERPNQLWHIDITKVWVVEHGWVPMLAGIDCCTREIVEWELELRCRAKDVIAFIMRACKARGIGPDELTVGTDNGPQFTARDVITFLRAEKVTHRRGGYRDPESQAFIESWFGRLKTREVWASEYQNLDEARAAIGKYIDNYHNRPHSRLGYQTPNEVATLWKNHQNRAA